MSMTDTFLYEDEVPAEEARTSRLFSVAIYHEQLCWGGPEEGGWWFSAGELLPDRPVRYFRNEEAAYRFCRRLNHLIDLLVKHRYEYSSVLSEGQLAARVEAGHPVKHYPETRPHYE
jgi:hypothetical protein